MEMTKREYSEPENLDSVAGLEPESGARKKRNVKSKNKNKRRFSDEQISSLETIFEADSKLEPRRKVQLARELGLQPRQVAIWFQNKRARWKSKQIEQDLRALRADYDNLTSKFESLSKEKQNLITQLEKLNDLVGKKNCTAEGSSYKDGNLETTQVRSNDLGEELGQRESEKKKKKNNNNNKSNGDCEYGDEGQEQLMNMGHVDAYVSPHDWHRSFDSGILFDPSRCNSQWFNFWT